MTTQLLYVPGEVELTKLEDTLEAGGKLSDLQIRTAVAAARYWARMYKALLDKQDQLLETARQEGYEDGYDAAGDYDDGAA